MRTKTRPRKLGASSSSASTTTTTTPTSLIASTTTAATSAAAAVVSTTSTTTSTAPAARSAASTTKERKIQEDSFGSPKEEEEEEEKQEKNEEENGLLHLESTAFLSHCEESRAGDHIMEKRGDHDDYDHDEVHDDDAFVDGNNGDKDTKDNSYGKAVVASTSQATTTTTQPARPGFSTAAGQGGAYDYSDDYKRWIQGIKKDKKNTTSKKKLFDLERPPTRSIQNVRCERLHHSCNDDDDDDDDETVNINNCETEEEKSDKEADDGDDRATGSSLRRRRRSTCAHDVSPPQRKRGRHSSRLGADVRGMTTTDSTTMPRTRSLRSAATAAAATPGLGDDEKDDDIIISATPPRSCRSSTSSQRRQRQHHHQQRRQPKRASVNTVRRFPSRLPAAAASSAAASTVDDSSDEDNDDDGNAAFPRHVATTSSTAGARASACHRDSNDSSDSDEEDAEDDDDDDTDDDDGEDSGPVSRKGLPDIYIAGAELCMGESNRFAYYTHDNDTLCKIAQRYDGISVQQLLRDNQNALPGLTIRSKLKPYTCMVMPAQHFVVDKNVNHDNASDIINNDAVDIMAYGPRLPRDDLCDLDEEGSTMLLQESNRFVYYACNNDTPHQIAKRFDIPVDRILFDNAKAYPGMTRHCKLKPFTCIVMPIVKPHR